MPRLKSNYKELHDEWLNRYGYDDLNGQNLGMLHPGNPVILNRTAQAWEACEIDEDTIFDIPPPNRKPFDYSLLPEELG